MERLEKRLCVLESSQVAMFDMVLRGPTPQALLSMIPNCPWITSKQLYTIAGMGATEEKDLLILALEHPNFDASMVDEFTYLVDRSGGEALKIIFANDKICLNCPNLLDPALYNNASYLSDPCKLEFLYNTGLFHPSHELLSHCITQQYPVMADLLLSDPRIDTSKCFLPTLTAWANGKTRYMSTKSHHFYMQCMAAIIRNPKTPVSVTINNHYSLLSMCLQFDDDCTTLQGLLSHPRFEFRPLLLASEIEKISSVRPAYFYLRGRGYKIPKWGSQHWDEKLGSFRDKRWKYIARIFRRRYLVYLLSLSKSVRRSFKDLHHDILEQMLEAAYFLQK